MSKKVKIIIGVVVAVIVAAVIAVVVFINASFDQYDVIQTEYGVDISYDNKDILTLDGYTECYYYLWLYNEKEENRVTFFELYLKKGDSYELWKVDKNGEVLEDKAITKEEYESFIDTDGVEKAVSAKETVKKEAKAY